jgi:hypothetical protein
MDVVFKILGTLIVVGIIGGGSLSILSDASDNKTRISAGALLVMAVFCAVAAAICMIWTS